MIRMTPAIIAIAAVGALVAACGCTNEPGALKMTVEPEKPVFRSDEPLRLNVTLEPVKGPVCLWESSHLLADVVAADGSPPLTGRRDYWICGTPLFGTLPFLPVILAIAVFDVGDVHGRLPIMKKGDERQFSLSIVKTGEHSARIHQCPSRFSQEEPLNQPSGLPPGRYCIRVHLVNENESFGPAPLFWIPYSQPVVRSAIVHVEAPPAVASTLERTEDAATAEPLGGPERRGEPGPATGGILAAPPRRITRAAIVRGFEPDGCRLSTKPNADLPEAVAKHIELARAALERNRLLPPEWKLCAAKFDDGSWLVRCTPRGKALGAAWIPTTVLMRDGKVVEICEFQVFDPSVSDEEGQ